MKLNFILKELMFKHDLNPTDLSRVTDIPLSTLHGWLNGVEPKSIGQLKMLSDYFQVSLDYLCFGESPYIENIPKIHEEINIGNYEVILRKVKENI